jgi:nitrite reductase (NADH) small subunit
MPRVKIGSVSQIPAGSVASTVIGGDSYAVCHVDGQIHVLDGICPHAGGPLGQGALHGTTLVCPWHAWEYDCTTGMCTFSDEFSVTKFPVTISGDDILIDIP